MRLFPASITYRLPAASTATPVGSVSPEDKSRLGPPCKTAEVKSLCPRTLSALFPLVRLEELRHAKTRWLLVSATYKVLPDDVNVTPSGPSSSRPSIRLGVADVGGVCSRT